MMPRVKKYEVVMLAAAVLVCLGAALYNVVDMLQSDQTPVVTPGVCPAVSSEQAQITFAKPAHSPLRGSGGTAGWSASGQHSPYSHPYKGSAGSGISPVTYRTSSATLHSIGGGGPGGGMAGSSVGGSSSNHQSSIINYQLSTAVPLLAVNSSAFSVNRELTDQSGQSVAGMAMRRIAPPDDGGSGLGGPGNIAPPDDGGELLGSPVGDVPIVLMILLSIVYIVYIIYRRKESRISG